MAWSWSHTVQAYEYAHSQLGQLDREKLLEIRREWYASDPAQFATAFSQDKWDEAVRFQMFADLSDEQLAEDIWDRAYTQQVCDNGGWNAWVCPFGCHTVPFGPE